MIKLSKQMWIHKKLYLRKIDSSKIRCPGCDLNAAYPKCVGVKCRINKQIFIFKLLK